MIDIEQLARDSEELRTRAQATRRRAELVRQQASGFMTSLHREQQQSRQPEIAANAEYALATYVSGGLPAFAFEALDRANQSLNELLERKQEA